MQWDKLNLDVTGFWYIIAGAVLTVGYTLYMPKRLSWREIYLTFGVVSTLSFVSHTIVGVWFDAVDLGRKGGYDVADILVMVGISPAMAVIFLNHVKPNKKWIYAITFSIISFLYEWGATQVGFFHLKEWRSWWSFIVYLFIFGLFLPWHLSYIRKERAITQQYNSPKKLDVNKLYRMKGNIK